MNINPIDPNELKIGYELPEYVVEISAQKYRKYNRLIKEINPIHISKKYAQRAGYDTIIVAGNYLFTFIPKWLVDWIADVNPIKNITINFVNPVYPDDKLIHQGKINEIEELDGSKILKCEYTVKKSNNEITASGEIILSFKLP
ncbi:MAG: MaoC family dehydratase [Promethearchaeota archaeon]